MLIDVDVLGAGREIGRSCIILTFERAELKARVMLDCGVHVAHKDPSTRYPDFRKYLKLAPETSNEVVGRKLTETIDAVLITHIHLDHLGALPYLTERLGYQGPVIGSPPTKGLGALLLADFLRSGDFFNPPEGSGKQQYACSAADAFASLEKIKPIQLGQSLYIPARQSARGLVEPGSAALEIKAHLAGHVLGALAFEVRFAGLSALYTGDFNTNTDRLISKAAFPALSRPDVLISEGTYAIHVKDNRHTVEREMCRVVLATLRAGGKVLVPCFAVGKAQEIATCLIEFLRECKDSFPLLIGGAMTEKVNAQYKQFIEWSRSAPSMPEEELTSLRAESVPLDDDLGGPSERVKSMYRLASEIRHVESEKDFLRSPLPGVLFAAPAMLTGGLSLQALKEWASNPKNLIVMTGSCVPGTIGNKLVVGAKSVQINARSTLTIACKVRYFPFANHAGYFGLRRIIEEVDPVSLMMVHGDKEGVFTLGSEVANKMGIPVFCPRNFETIKIDVAKWRQLRSDVSPLNGNVEAMCLRDPLRLGSQGVPVVGVMSSLSPTEPKRYFAELISKQLSDRTVTPPISAHQLLLEPALWPGIERWLQSLAEGEEIIGSPLTEPSSQVSKEDEDGEMEEGCLPDDEETATAAIALTPMPSQANNLDFTDSRHEVLFRSVLARTAAAPVPERHPEMQDMSPLERHLALLHVGRPVVRISGWVCLAGFRDLVAALESMNGTSGSLGYLERNGYGVLVFHAMSLSIVVALAATTRQTLLEDLNAEIDRLRAVKSPHVPVRLGRFGPTGEPFRTPMIIQIGKPELHYLMSVEEREEKEQPLKINFWQQLRKLFIPNDEIHQLLRASAKPTILPKPPNATRGPNAKKGGNRNWSEPAATPTPQPPLIAVQPGPMPMLPTQRPEILTNVGDWGQQSWTPPENVVTPPLVAHPPTSAEQVPKDMTRQPQMQGHGWGDWGQINDSRTPQWKDPMQTWDANSWSRPIETTNHFVEQVSPVPPQTKPPPENDWENSQAPKWDVNYRRPPVANAFTEFSPHDEMRAPLAPRHSYPPDPPGMMRPLDHVQAPVMPPHGHSQYPNQPSYSDDAAPPAFRQQGSPDQNGPYCGPIRDQRMGGYPPHGMPYEPMGPNGPFPHSPPPHGQAPSGGTKYAPPLLSHPPGLRRPHPTPFSGMGSAHSYQNPYGSQPENVAAPSGAGGPYSVGHSVHPRSIKSQMGHQQPMRHTGGMGRHGNLEQSPPGMRPPSPIMQGGMGNNQAQFDGPFEMQQFDQRRAPPGVYGPPHQHMYGVPPGRDVHNGPPRHPQQYQYGGGHEMQREQQVPMHYAAEGGQPGWQGNEYNHEGYRGMSESGNSVSPPWDQGQPADPFAMKDNSRHPPPWTAPR